MVPVNRQEERIGGTAFSMSGTGRPVVLVHGLGLNRHMWQWQLDALTPRFRVIRYDLPGHGGSDKPRGPCSMEQMVDQLLTLIDDLELGVGSVLSVFQKSAVQGTKVMPLFR